MNKVKIPLKDEFVWCDSFQHSLPLHWARWPCHQNRRYLSPGYRLFCRSLTMVLLERIVPYLRKCYEYLRNLNFFPSITAATEPSHCLRNQIISTRLSIYLFLHALFILLFYTFAVTINKTLTLSLPTRDQYNQLHQQYPVSLTCPCTTISINYDRFVHLNFTLHQVCSSDFVSNRWLAYLSQNRYISLLPVSDFRITSVFAFQGLQSNAYAQFVNSDTYSATVSISYDGCLCTRSALCVTPAMIESVVTSESAYRVRGMLTGCYFLEALLQSTLECFFDQLCLMSCDSIWFRVCCGMAKHWITRWKVASRRRVQWARLCRSWWSKNGTGNMATASISVNAIEWNANTRWRREIMQSSSWPQWSVSLMI